MNGTNCQKKNEQTPKFSQVILPSTYDESSLFGRVFHIWKWAFFIRHYNKEVKMQDIPQCPRSFESKYALDQFESHWENEMKNALSSKRSPSLFWPIFKTNFFFMIFISFFCFSSQLLLIVQAVFMGKLVRDSQLLDNDESINANLHKDIYLYCAAMILSQFFYVQLINIYNFYTFQAGVKLKVILGGLIYQKSLKLSKFAFNQTSPGQIINILSNDLNKLDYIFMFIPYPLLGLVMIGLVVWILWEYLGYFTLYGIMILVLIIPFQALMGKLFTKLRAKGAILSDERIRLMNEFIPAIRVIKMYSWENKFAKLVNVARKKEISKIRSAAYLFSLNLGLFFVSSKIVIYAILVTYVLYGNFLNSELVFIAFALINKMTFICTLFIPHFVNTVAQGNVSLRRVRDFLLLDELGKNQSNYDCDKILNDKANLSIINYSGNYESNSLYAKFLSKKKDSPFYSNMAFESDEKEVDDSKVSISCTNCNNAKTECQFHIKSKLDNQYVLNNINFNCIPNQLIVIVGPVGSGKSSILMAILGELKTKKGEINVQGQISYACQESWTFAGTVKENILFGNEFDEIRYNEVIRVCALERDMFLFPQGDKTIIGERGVALSGGQRARINLARSLYYDADIYLLDDPLSAVDPHVAKHIFNEAIKKFLSTKIVILVTHQLQFIKSAHKILLIKEGKQVAYGNYATLLACLNNKVEFSKFIGVNLNEQKIRKDHEQRLDSNQFGSMVSISSDQKIPLKREMSIDSTQIDLNLVENMIKAQDNLNKPYKKAGREIIKEVSILKASTHAYYVYFKLGLSGYLGPVLIIIFIVTQALYSFSDYWLSLWTHSEELRHNQSTGAHEHGLHTSFVDNFTTKENVIFYTILMITLFTLSLIRALLFFKFCMRASVKLHDRVFRNVVRAPMSFFDNNPIGILLNRVSRDMGIIDDMLPIRFFDSLDVMFIDISIGIMIVILNPYILAPLFFLIVVVIISRKLFITTAKYVRTLEGIAKSPVLQHMSSTLNGLTTIRAFKSQKKFQDHFDMLQNDHSSTYFMFLCNNRWFVYLLDSIQVFYIAGVLIVMCIFSDYFTGSIMGLVISSTLLFCSEFQWMVKNWAEVETLLTSVDRLDQYSDLPTEAALESESNKKPPDSWPQYGKIEFKNVTMRYFEDEAPVLSDLTFTINSKDKIGVAGRTGAGKSSIIAALFRMTEYEGDILIDGIRCKSIGLHDLRKKIAIIPQEPVLFTGTVRSNLDPFNEHSDAELWTCLRETQLNKNVEDMPGELDAKISDNGSNFSSGQKQLLCLARAILRNNRILVLDEATANCDPRTDELIQKTIRTVFSQCTIITIAHRLNTIMDSNKILVLDAGKLKEYDTPFNLIKEKSTQFRSMVDSTGKEMSSVLIKMVKDSFNLNNEST